MASLAHRLLAPMFAIKLLSVIGNLFAVWAVCDLIKTCGGRGHYAIMLLAVPSFVINAALLAQCDALWAGACVLAVSGMKALGVRRARMGVGEEVGAKQFADGSVAVTPV